MAHELTNFIFGRAILTAQQLTIFNRNTRYINFIRNGQAQKMACEQYQLWFPQLNLDYDGLWAGRRSITGLMVLEAVQRREDNSTRTTPIGVLIFICDHVVRNKILEQCTFTNKDLCDRQLEIRWLTHQSSLALHTEVEFDQDVVDFSWESLWREASCLATMPTPPREHPPVHPSAFVLDRWTFTAMMEKWYREQGICTYVPAQVEGGRLRSLDSIEYMWLLYHVWLRWRRDRTQTVRIAKLVVAAIRLDHPPLVIPTWLDKVQTLHKLDFSHNQAFMFMNLHGATRQMLANMKSISADYNECVAIVHRYIGEPMQALRDRLHPFPLYVGHLLREFTQQCNDTMPLNPLDVDKHLQWAKAQYNHLKSEYTVERIFRSVYENAMMLTHKNAFIRLYGNSRHLLQHLHEESCKFDPNRQSINVILPAYRLENMGRLSDESRRPWPVYALARSRARYIVDNRQQTPAAARLSEAASMCLPIWTSYRSEHSNACIFHRVSVAYDAGSDDVDDPPLPMGVEYVQNGLHCSQFYADLDMYPTAEIDDARLYKDLHECMTNIMERACNGLQPTSVYIFRSVGADSGGKVGLHLHAILSPGTVMTTKACQDLAIIMETVRHMYPKTLGQTKYGSEVFDRCVYPIGNDPRGHCLRGPYQSKADGSRMLTCVYRTDGLPINKEIPAHHRFVHGPQFDPITGQPILFGTVIEGIEGINNITDVAFVRRLESETVNDYVHHKCRQNPCGIMRELNKRRLLFSCVIEGGEDDAQVKRHPRYAAERDLLVEVVNELWRLNGRDNMIAHMNTAVGADEHAHYEHSHIQMIQQQSCFIYDKKRDTISLSMDGGRTTRVHFCPNRPHRRGIASRDVQVDVTYMRGMVRFGLISRCFKPFCRRDGWSVKFVPKVMMTMPNVFVAPCIQRMIQESVMPMLLAPDVDVLQVVVDE